jgi:CRISPR-associated endonuclease/helicase Cas3
VIFADFFRAIWCHDPFPWQERLAELVLEGRWPSSIGLPTAAGKTALIDIAVYALAMRAPEAARRTFFVVDRRVIVDEAAERAAELASKLAQAKPDSDLRRVAASLRGIGDGAGSCPLEAAVLRGGIARDDSWTRSPRQPLVICSTVDQVGSSLLFRAYGTREYTWPIRAGPAACDSLIVLDEAHTSQPFAETLGRIRHYRRRGEMAVAGPFKVVEMSAIPRGGEAFREAQEDHENELLRQRWEAPKRVRLVVEDEKADNNERRILQRWRKDYFARPWAQVWLRGTAMIAR